LHSAANFITKIDFIMSVIEDIKQQISILDMCQMLGIAVNRSTGKARSFINNDSNPSLQVYSRNNRFKDYSANVAGDVIDMYAAYHRIDKKRAVQELAKLVHSGEVSREQHHHRPAPVADTNWVECLSADERYFYEERLGMGEDEADLKKVLRYRRMQDNADIYREFAWYCQDKGWDSAAYRYLTDMRKLPHEVLKRFRIFTISNYNEVNNHMKKKFDRDALIRSGLYRLRDDGAYNLTFFSYRIIIPYMWRGEIVYLRGRYFDVKGNATDPEKKASKYLGVRNDGLGVNTPKRFYNADVLEKLMPREIVYMTEGELDTVAIESLGYNAVAIAGVGNVPDARQWDRIRGLTVKLALDNDGPGKKLAEAVTPLLLQRGNFVKQLDMRDCKDANEWLVKYGR
jgi:DNA primase